MDGELGWGSWCGSQLWMWKNLLEVSTSAVNMQNNEIGETGILEDMR